MFCHNNWCAIKIAHQLDCSIFRVPRKRPVDCSLFHDPKYALPELMRCIVGYGASWDCKLGQLL